MIFVSACLLVAGTLIDAFNFEFKGLSELLLHSLNLSSSGAYSLVTLAESLSTTSSAAATSFNVIFLQGTFCLFSIVAPFVHLVLMFVLWVVPCTLRTQHRLFYATEIVYAWSAVDVFLITIIASLVELQLAAQFLVGNRCDLINALVAQLHWPSLADDAKCFDVIATLSEGAWALIISTMFSLISSFIVMVICRDALVQRTLAAWQQSGDSSGDIEISDDDNNSLVKKSIVVQFLSHFGCNFFGSVCFRLGAVIPADVDR